MFGFGSSNGGVLGIPNMNKNVSTPMVCRKFI